MSPALLRVSLWPLTIQSMKSKVLTLVFCLVLMSDLFACEICGCGNNQFQIGLLPNFTKGFFGYRYAATRFSSQVKNEPGEFSNDHYRTMEIWGGYSVKKFQLIGFLPYTFSKKQTDDGTIIANGPGDLMLLVNYRLLDNGTTARAQHQLFVGAGVKFPTGRNSVDPLDPEFNVGDFNSQAGTGSTDYLITATHNMMWRSMGVITNAAYRMNGENHRHYRFGNRMYLSSSVYYSVEKSKFNIKPNVGLNFQSNAINKFEGAAVEDSNGFVLNATAGVNLMLKRLGLNVSGFLPVAQNFYDHQTQMKSRFIVGLTYSL